MVNTKTKKMFWIYLVLFVLVLGGFCFLVYLISKDKTEIKVLKAKVYSEENQVKEIDNLKRLITTTEDGRQRIADLFVSDSSMVDFLEEIENLGRLSGSKVEVVSVGEEKTSDKSSKDQNKDTTAFSKMKVRFTGEGSWKTVYKFVGLVSNFGYSMEITGMDLSVDEGVWKAVFEILVDKV